MNKEQWLKYNRRIVGEPKTETELGITGGELLNRLMDNYLDNRSIEVYQSFLNDFTNPKSYAELLNGFCNQLASTESIMLGIVQLLSNLDDKNDWIVRHNARGIKKVIRRYFQSNLKDSRALKKYHQGFN